MAFILIHTTTIYGKLLDKKPLGVSDNIFALMDLASSQGLGKNYQCLQWVNNKADIDFGYEFQYPVVDHFIIEEVQSI